MFKRNLLSHILQLQLKQYSAHFNDYEDERLIILEAIDAALYRINSS